MKRLILTIAITAFAITAYAGGEACAAANKAASAKDQKATCTTLAKNSADAKMACCATKTACSGKELRQALQSPKGAELAKR